MARSRAFIPISIGGAIRPCGVAPRYLIREGTKARAHRRGLFEGAARGRRAGLKTRLPKGGEGSSPSAQVRIGLWRASFERPDVALEERW